MIKAGSAVAAVILSLTATIGSASAQYGGPDYGYRDRGYRERDRYDDRDRGYRERDRGYGDRRAGFDEREYLRCNPDVRRAVSRGQFGGSGLNHDREYGRRENRRLSC